MDLDLVNMFVLAGGTLAIPILAFVASFLLCPAALIRFYYWYWRTTLSMQVKNADYGNYRFCYSTRGKPGNKPSILMLHGFSAHKDMWLSVVKFVECIGLNRKPFHLIGTSMGGNVAGVYAARHPTDLCGLTLICPAGLECPKESKFVKGLRSLEQTGDVSKVPLIPSTPDEMEEMLKLCSYVRFKVPQQILQGLVDVRLPHNDFYRQLFLEIAGEKSRHTLQEHMNQIKAPTQVIWGKQDQVLDVSGAGVLAENIPGCRVDFLENCGHSVVMERPRKSAKLLLEFSNWLQGRKSESSKKLA
ncbi:monoacylglycerol lipase abhd6-A isoform X2 [Rhinoraja longicauda]